MLFPPGVGADMVFPNGSQAGLDQMTVHITEYTVGEDGPAAMPAELPPTSAYTYCVEFTVEEAEEAGAYRVEFSSPVVNYLENFLGFQAGDPVPVGVYNRLEGCWEPEPDGLVVRVLSIDQEGRAVLDVDGGGEPASEGELAGLGITSEELTTVGGLYAPGDTLWRVPLEHFSPCDYNYAIVFPSDAISPDPDDVIGESKDPCDELTGGSLIEITNQILRETIGVVGTPFTLNYASDRVPGRKSATTLTIPLTGETVPASLREVELVVEVAGQRFKETFGAGTNLNHEFQWGGRDPYGRVLQGSQPVSISIGYVYDGVYVRDVSRSLTRTFGFPRATASQVGTRRPVRKWTHRRATIRAGGWDARGLGLGGWSLSSHHVYDPAGQVVYFGDGSRQSGAHVGPTIDTIAGTDSSGFSGDGGPATEAALAGPQRVAVGADGAVYVSDTENHRIRRIDGDGTMTTIVGTGNPGFNGDGLVGTMTQVDSPMGLAFGPDGRLYFADAGNGRIRRLEHNQVVSTVLVGQPFGGGGPPAAAFLTAVAPEHEYGDPGSSWPWYVGQGGGQTPVHPVGLAVGPDCVMYIADPIENAVWRMGTDGVVTSIAGTGDFGFSGDGGPSVEAALGGPEGVAITPAGELLIADTGNNRIRKVGIDGIITTVAGNGDDELSGDGEPALETPVASPVDVAAGPGGDTFFIEQGTHRVPRVRPDGTVRTVTGTGQLGFAGDRGPAVEGRLFEPTGLAAAPDGSVLIADTGNSRIRKVSSPFGGATGEMLIPSADASLIYRFDDNGRHLETIHGLTGGVLYSFTYDANGLLTEVRDGDGNTTTIERDSAGQASSITGPFGQQTLLAYDGDGYLASIANPAGEAVRLTYADGLLTSLTDPNGNPPYQFDYDALGRLTKDTDPAGGFKELARTELEHGHEVSVTTAEGRVSRYRTEHLDTGEERHTTVAPEGTTTVTVTRPDGSSETTDPHGTSRTQVGPDPRFGMQVPLLTSLVTTTGGRTLSETFHREVVLSQPDDPLSVQQLVDTSTANGKTYSSVYTASDFTVVETTPGGREITSRFDALGRIVSVGMPGLAPTAHEYDPLGRLVGTTRSDGTTTRTSTFTYDAQGFLGAITDPGSRTLSFERDAAGRVLTATLPGGAAVGLAYDANGNLVSITPPDRPSHTLSRNAVNLLSTYTPPDGGPTAYLYNLDQELVREMRPGGEQIEQGYDAAGRLETQTIPRGTIQFGYDPVTGDRTSFTDPSGAVQTLAYSGALLTDLDSTGTANASQSWTHDSEFQVRSHSIAGNSTIFDYDDDGFLTQVGPMSIARDATTGLPVGTTLGTLSAVVDYNAFGERTLYRISAGGQVLLEEHLSRDSLGRVQEKHETFDGLTRTFGYFYDPAGRLERVTVNGAPNSSYGFDANGNRTSHVTADFMVSGRYDDRDQLLAYGDASYSYNANGAMAAKTEAGQTTSYEYDTLGNLLAVRSPDKQVEYQVDAHGRRLVKKLDGVVVSKWVYAGGHRPVAELAADDTIVSVFVGEYMVRGSDTFQLVSDHLGSIRLVVDSSDGTVVQKLDYDEYGNVLEDTNPGFQPLGYCGGLYDADTGLVRFGARDYDPAIGRWLAPDPILFLGYSTNLYAYVGGDPINRFDRNGLAVESPWDAANVALGVGSLVANTAAGNYGGALWDAAGLVYDVGATAVPGLPAGASAAIKAGRAGQAAADFYRGTKLAENLYQAGRGVRAGEEAAHHIVAQGAKKAAAARKKLEDLGIDVNDACNGVGLPVKYHRRLHTNDYYRHLNEAAKSWNTREEAMAGLEAIRQQLLKASSTYSDGPVGFP